MLSISPERPVPPATLEVLRAVDRVTRELGVDYFVLGATARDIVLYGVFGTDPDRGTQDVDLAVAVRDWPEFEQVKAALVQTNEFGSDSSIPIDSFITMIDLGRRTHSICYRSAELRTPRIKSFGLRSYRLR